MKKVEIKKKLFGLVKKGSVNESSTTIKNSGDEPVCVSDVSSNNSKFPVELRVVFSAENGEVFTDELGSAIKTCKELRPQAPKNATIYSDEFGNIKDSSGKYNVTDLGFGIAGTTDENGVYTVYGISDPEGIVFSDEESFIFTDEEGSLMEDILGLFSFEDGA